MCRQPRLLEQTEAYRERVASTVSGLLALLGIVVDPITSREHILLANVLDHSWRAGHDLDMASLIQAVQSPPFQKVGVLDLETFFPAKERFALAMKLNNLAGLTRVSLRGWMAIRSISAVCSTHLPESHECRSCQFHICRITSGCSLLPFF